MKKLKLSRIQDLVGLINGLFPTALAEEWDNVGLQVGDPAAPVGKVLVCLDVSAAVLRAASEGGAEAVVSHHPLIFRPLKSLTPRDETGQLLLESVRRGISVISAHTNLDRAVGGLNDWLADRLGVRECQPLLHGAAGDLLKLVVFVPRGYEGPVAEAIFAAGAGQIGAYDNCSFRSSGFGTYRPGEGTQPFLGRQGQTETAAEVRLETIVPRERLVRVVDRMRKAHPYEEVAYDLLPLANQRSDVGLGRLGFLSEKMSLADFAAQVKQSLGAASLRMVGDPAATVARVALCGGSGASLISEALRRGADVLVTGDLKYHEARAAESQGLALIDAGHFATEHLMVEAAVDALSDAARRRNMDIEFHAFQGEADPFRLI